MKVGDIVKRNKSYIQSDNNKDRIYKFISKVYGECDIIDNKIFDNDELYDKKFIIITIYKTSEIPTRCVYLMEKNNKEFCFYIQARYCIVVREPKHKLTSVFV